MIAQCKGKDLVDVPASKLKPGIWFGSTKFDGHFGQIHKLPDCVVFYTSGGKPFKLPNLEKAFMSAFGNMSFVLEYEYNKAGEGKLGDRTKCGKLTTYRTNTEKNISNHSIEGNEIFRVFDIISFRGLLVTVEFSNRLKTLTQLSKNFPERVILVEFDQMELEDHIVHAKQLRGEGWEGKYIKHSTHRYLPGKRVNDAIKLKNRPTADLLCIGFTPGKDSYEGMIGSLQFKDSNGRVVNVNSGLEMSDRDKDPGFYIGKIMEIEYEQILDTYIQPAFHKPNNKLVFRDDKTKEDIS